MEESVLTYEELRKIQRKERLEGSLAQLDADFVKKVQKYFRDKQKVLDKSKGDDVFSENYERLSKELQNAKNVIRDIYDRRESKIISQASMQARASKKIHDTTRMLPDEEALYYKLLDVIANQRKTLLNPLLSMENFKNGRDSNTLSNTIRFIKHVPSFTGLDNHVYGPFDADDVARLPDELTELMIARKQAVRINEDAEENNEVLPEVQDSHGTESD